MTSVWRSWGKSVIGPAHIRSSMPNQDAWSSKKFKWGHVVVVADGLGSHKYSSIGSQAACKAVVSIAKIYGHVVNLNIERMLKAIHAKWIQYLQGYTPSVSSTTCLFVMKIHEKYIVAQLGDGLIMGYTSNDQHNFLLQEDKKDSFSNVTNGLRKNFIFKDWRYEILESRFEAFILCTDGISDDLIVDKELDFGKELLTVYRKYSNQRIVRHLQKWLINWPVEQHSDDKTIACLYRRHD